MNLNTQRINNFEPHNTLDSHKRVCSEEYRVLAILRLLFPKEFDDVIKCESPDLQSKEREYGIEVTSLDFIGERQASAEFIKRGSKSNSNRQKSINKLKKDGYEVLTHDIGEKEFDILSSGGSYNIQAYYRVFLDRVNKKIRKVFLYNARVKTVDLAVLFNGYVSIEIIEQIPYWIKRILQISVFKRIFVIYNNCLGMYEIDGDKWVSKNIQRSSVQY